MKKILLLAGILALPACSTFTTTPEIAYQPTNAQNELYDLQRWAFDDELQSPAKMMRGRQISIGSIRRLKILLNYQVR